MIRFTKRGDMAGKLSIGLAGATGLVGRTAIDVFSERFPDDCSFHLFATGNSAGRVVRLCDREITVERLPDAPPELDYALFCVPGRVAAEYVPEWRKAGIRIIDNSSVFRMNDDVPLVVPEVNPETIADAQGLIANPNCSTIQLAVALAPIHRAFGLKAVRVSTYQAVSGAGAVSVTRWREEIVGMKYTDSPFPRPIHGNVIPQIGDVDAAGFNVEEVKLMRELPKILAECDLPVTATAVRVPVAIGHSEAVEFELMTRASLEDLLQALEQAEGVVLYRDPGDYPTPIEVCGSDSTHVGRVRSSPADPDTFLLWVVADNLRKGAATNAVQILEMWAGLETTER